MEDLMVKEEGVSQCNEEKAERCPAGFKDLETARMHYNRLKEKDPGAFLFFHQGLFYELYFEDARRVSEIFGLLMLSLGVVPALRIPENEYKDFISIVTARGYRATICEKEDLDPDSAEFFTCRKVYDKLKNENPDSFLFFHQEFFYELYFEDAGKVSEILKRPLLYLEDVPTLRFSKEERDNFITTMNNLGYTVALCQSSGQKTEVEDLRGQLERSLEEVRKLERFLSDVRQHTRLVAHYLQEMTGYFKNDVSDFNHAMFLVERDGVKKEMRGKLINNYAINKEDLHAIEHIIFTINSEAIKLEDSL